MNSVTPSLLLLTYKGKALLMHKQKSVIDTEKYPWSFISVVSEKKDSLEKAFLKCVHKEMGIKIEKIEYVSEYCYHARLTDENVNSIQRSEHQLLDFFTLKEINKLFLSKETEEFISKHGLIVTAPRSGYSE
jgi:NADH pyrophosphatase NudC (nudix superfamily)